MKKIILAIFVLLLLPLSVKADIGYDTSTQSGFGAGTSRTTSLTSGAIANPLILAAAYEAAVADTVTGCTANGAAMTKVASRVGSVNVSKAVSLWYAIPTSTGSLQTVTCSAGLSITMNVVAASYSGVKQVSPLDSFNSGVAASTSPYTTSTVVSASNSWVMMVVADSGNEPVASTGVTKRQGTASATAYGDSNTGAPPGAYSMSWTNAANDWVGVIASFAPATSGSGSTELVPVPISGGVADSGGATSL